MKKLKKINAQTGKYTCQSHPESIDTNIGSQYDRKQTNVNDKHSSIFPDATKLPYKNS